MYYSKVVGQLGKKQENIKSNSIPKLDEIDVIKYETNKGVTKYKLSVLENGDRFMFEDGLLEEVFTVYMLDEKYSREKITSLMPVEEMMKYDYARDRNLNEACDELLSGFVQNLNYNSLKEEKTKVYKL